MKNEIVVRLFDSYANDLYRFALSYVGIKQEAEDIVQNVFTKLLIKNIRIQEEYEKAYLYKMTANLCKDHLKAHKEMLNYDDLVDLVGKDSEIVDDEADIYQCLMGLNPTYRIPLYLHYYEGYTYGEISKILNIGESAIAMRIHRGKEELKQNWRKHYGE